MPHGTVPNCAEQHPKHTKTPNMQPIASVIVTPQPCAVQPVQPCVESPVAVCNSSPLPISLVSPIPHMSNISNPDISIPVTVSTNVQIKTVKTGGIGRSLRGWPGMLLCVFMAGGVFGILYYATRTISTEERCSTHEDCGKLTNGYKWNCLTPVCDASEPYTSQQRKRGGEMIPVASSYINTHAHLIHTCTSDDDSTLDLSDAMNSASVKCTDGKTVPSEELSASLKMIASASFSSSSVNGCKNNHICGNIKDNNQTLTDSCDFGSGDDDDDGKETQYVVMSIVTYDSVFSRVLGLGSTTKHAQSVQTNAQALDLDHTISALKCMSDAADKNKEWEIQNLTQTSRLGKICDDPTYDLSGIIIDKTKNLRLPFTRNSDSSKPRKKVVWCSVRDS